MELAGCFIKFGQLEHLQALRDRGLLYCNSISYFLDIEDKGLRGDTMENVLHLKHIQNGTMWVRPVYVPDSQFKKIDFYNGKVTGRASYSLGNLFCLYAINVVTQPLNTVITIDPRNKEFGGHFLLIMNPHEFLTRLNKKLSQMNVSYSYGLVEYVDLSKHDGDKSLFQKDLAYSYQREFRLHLKSKVDEPMVIEIGSIADIACILEASHVDTFELQAVSKNGDSFRIHCNKQLSIPG